MGWPGFNDRKNTIRIKSYFSQHTSTPSGDCFGPGFEKVLFLN